MFRARSNQSGVALVAVLLIFAVLTALVIRLTNNHALVIAQSSYTFVGDQSLAYAMGAEELARQALYQDFVNGTAALDHYGEDWAQALPPLELDEGGFIEVQLSDAGSCFNLNTLTGNQSAQAQVLLATLLQNAGLPRTIAEVAKDWVDFDQDVSGFGAEEGQYMLRTVPYRTPDTMMGHVSEIALWYQLEPEQRQVLRTLVCALPSDALTINVNTAPLEVIAALVPQLDPNVLSPLAETERRFGTVQEFVDQYQDFQNAAELLSVQSEFFRMDARAQIDETSAVLSTLLHRSTADGALTVVGRDLGREFVSRVTVEVEEVDQG